MNLHSDKIFIFGAGPVGLAHHDAFRSLGCEVQCINRSGGSKTTLFGLDIDITPLAAFDMHILEGAGVVISLPINQQLSLYSQILEMNPRFILLEKPGTFDLIGLRDIATRYQEATNSTYVGYNRRFFRSVTALKNILENEQVYSVTVDWSENIPRLLSLVSDNEVLENWHLANSCHLFDLAMFLADSKEYSLKYKYVAGKSGFNSLPGRGLFHMISENMVSLEMKFDFMQSGSWSVEVVSESGRYRLAPLEQLTKFDEGSFSYQTLKIQDGKNSIKEGFAEQARAILYGSKHLCRFDSNLWNITKLNELMQKDDTC